MAANDRGGIAGNRRAGLEQAFTAALAKARKITRGPKPVRRLRELGLKPDRAVEPPTTAGIIAALASENLAGRRIAIQLYPDNPNVELFDFLRGAGAAPDPVSYTHLTLPTTPYV